ncbi:PP2C family protein-serine/threonine phosphatase [Pseudonocardia asaccharolytica]|uniref:Serine/threonine phosphatase n=1 Tax=Pseudonocardia asaccharolytica DSM 44247 = NBRC 16224 TaxID=1123024 RepID=A0A511D099_9PSEU|nr:SpoIIE family protein phosphatase [Pseudonocardia asaccharolytica]GEL18225.1 serine/threonine phosphatase [Pseudonocardia asaccharolytica DSM 44247 = NBRC 16224]
MTRPLPGQPSRRVVLVEDDPGDVFLVQELLAEVAPEIRLLVAGSVAEAIQRGLLVMADCVLLDLNVPGSRDLEGLREVLQADPFAAVCVLTGLDDEYLGIAAVGIGAQDYLVKGKADGPVLIRAIRYAVERRRAEASLVRLREQQLAAAESARLERGLLPSPLLAGSRVRARSFYRSGRIRSLIGGDFFDAVLGPSGAVHAIVGDVCGHGPDEAALGALLRVSWRALVLAGVDEPQLLSNLQEVLVSERHDPFLFTTVCTVVIAPSAGEALVRLAGHPAPVSLRPHPSTDSPKAGPPLGVVADAAWEPARLPLAPDWALLLYTDGLIEGRGPDPEERLWEEGLLELLDEERDTGLDELPGRLAERVQKINGGPLADDMAILLLSGAGREG